MATTYYLAMCECSSGDAEFTKTLHTTEAGADAGLRVLLLDLYERYGDDDDGAALTLDELIKWQQDEMGHEAYTTEFVLVVRVRSATSSR